MLPALRYVAEGEEYRPRDTVEDLAEEFGLTPLQVQRVGILSAAGHEQAGKVRPIGLRLRSRWGLDPAPLGKRDPTLP